MSFLLYRHMLPEGARDGHSNPTLRTLVAAILACSVFAAELTSTAPAQTTGNAEELTPAEVFALVADSIVRVESVDSEGAVQAFGSGVVVGQGVVVTNAHLLEGAAQALVHVGGDSHRIDEMLYEDRTLDIAVLAVPVDGTDAPIRSYSPLLPGTRVVAIRNPRGLDKTPSEGLFSGLRTGQGDNLLIQHTAATSPGSSGGGLFDLAGRLIGITTFGLSNSQNLNFAIPAREVGRAVVKAQFSPNAITLAGRPPSPKPTATATEGVRATSFKWGVPIVSDRNGEIVTERSYAFSLVNSLQRPVADVRFTVSVRDREGNVMDFRDLTFDETIPPGFARRTSVRLETIAGVTAEPEVNVLDFKVVH